MNIAVCEENCEEAKNIIDLLNKYLVNIEISVNIYSFCSSESFLCEIEDGMVFNIVFLGVEKNGLVGIDSAYRLRTLKYKGELILVSSINDFAVDGYEVGAIGYLPKPCKVLTFRRLMDRISASFKIDTYVIKHRSNIVKVPFSDILYVESNNSKCTVHTSSGDNYTLYKRLSDIEEELSDNRFLRCHRSFLVNMNCIVSADKDFFLISGERILIRQKSLKEMKTKFFEFVSQETNL